MLEINIPGHNQTYLIEHLVFDYNGTLAVDGKLISGVKERLVSLSRMLSIHIITADTFGMTQDQMSDIPCRIEILGPDGQAEKKAAYVEALGSEKTICIGNGMNDHRMLKTAVLGIAVIQDEGAASKTLISSDVVCLSIRDALDLLLQPKRMIATLRM